MLNGKSYHLISRGLTKYIKHRAESRSSNENKRTVLYRDNEVFVDHDLVFVNQQNVAEYFVQAGEYKYPFQYTLPLNLPSRFVLFKLNTGTIFIKIDCLAWKRNDVM